MKDISKNVCEIIFKNITKSNNYLIRHVYFHVNEKDVIVVNGKEYVIYELYYTYHRKLIDLHYDYSDLKDI